MFTYFDLRYINSISHQKIEIAADIKHEFHHIEIVNKHLDFLQFFWFKGRLMQIWKSDKIVSFIWK